MSTTREAPRHLRRTITVTSTHSMRRDSRRRRAATLLAGVAGVAAQLAVAACAARPQTPPGLMVRHPDDSSKHVEYFVAKPTGAGPWPTIVFLHGHQDAPSAGGRIYVDNQALAGAASSGMLGVAVSVPGFGNSSGPDDFAGPFAAHGVEAVLDTLQRAGLAAPGKIVVLGVSLGAMTAGRVAIDRPTLAGVVMISGEYDLNDELTHPRSTLARGLAQAAADRLGGDSALVTRSLIHDGPRFHVPALILAGANDDRTNPVQGKALADSIVAHSGRARFVEYPGYGHQIPPSVRAAEIDAFVAQVLGRRN